MSIHTSIYKYIYIHLHVYTCIFLHIYIYIQVNGYLQYLELAKDSDIEMEDKVSEMHRHLNICTYERVIYVRTMSHLRTNRRVIYLRM